MTDVQPSVPSPAPVPSPQVAAGWYPHPTMAGTQRYWDGTAWTDHVAPLAQAPAPAAQPSGRTANNMKVSYTRQQQGHSIVLHVILIFVIVGIVTVPYHSLNPNHYWHA